MHVGVAEKVLELGSVKHVVGVVDLEAKVFASSMHHCAGEVLVDVEGVQDYFNYRSKEFGELFLGELEAREWLCELWSQEHRVCDLFFVGCEVAMGDEVDPIPDAFFQHFNLGCLVAVCCYPDT